MSTIDTTNPKQTIENFEESIKELEDIHNEYIADKECIQRILTKYGGRMSDSTKENLNVILADVDEFIQSADIFIEQVDKELTEFVQRIYTGSPEEAFKVLETSDASFGKIAKDTIELINKATPTE